MALHNPVRVRIAPSPTGPLHVGTARSALFNELFSRQHHGSFVVRIEDTDRERSHPEYEENILEGLRWLGLVWNEGPDVEGDYGPYRQSERSSYHRQALQRLLDEDKAYRDDGAVKLRVEPQAVSFVDAVRGDVTTHSDSWGGDFVIARRDDAPLFHLAVVVDDAAMAISHVIRGEDHLSNTARHILLQRALDLPTPTYAHIPLLLDDDRRKLSKRSHEVSLLSYRDQGYLPEALLNYLALLGWNPGTDQEFFTHDELIAAFSLDKVQKGGAIFSLSKLGAVNKHYIQQLSSTDLLDRSRPFFDESGVALDTPERLAAALATEQERVTTLAELPDALRFFMPDWKADYPPSLLIWKKGDAATMRERLRLTHEFLTAYPSEEFTESSLSTALLGWIDDHTLGRGETLWPLRVALTGREHSPGPFAVAAVLGKEETLRRLTVALTKLAPLV